MKSDRLFNIVYLLLSQEQATAKELAEKFEVSTRTIYRDIDTLSISGVPIYATKGTGGGIRLMRDYVFDKSMITDKNKNEIMVALDMLRATKYNSEEETLNKMGAIFGTKSRHFVDIDFSDFGPNNEKEIFACIKQGIIDNQALEISYKPYNKVEGTRVIYPLKLMFKKQRWYLIGFCKLREELRTFRITRIKSIVNINETFDIEMYPLENYEIEYGTPNNLINIMIILDHGCIDRVEEEFFSSYEIDENGHIVVHFNSPEDANLYAYLLSYLEHIRDVKPNSIKIELKKKVKNFLLI